MEKWSISAVDSDSLAPHNGPPSKILREIAWWGGALGDSQLIGSRYIGCALTGQHRADLAAQFIQRVRLPHEVLLAEFFELGAGLGGQVTRQHQDFYVGLCHLEHLEHFDA